MGGDPCGVGALVAARSPHSTPCLPNSSTGVPGAELPCREGRITFQGREGPHFVRSSVRGHSGCWNHTAMNMCADNPPVSLFWGAHAQENCCAYGNSVFNFIRTLLVFRGSRAMPLPHPQCTRAPVPPTPSPTLAIFWFLLVAILMGVQWDGCGFHLHSLCIFPGEMSRKSLARFVCFLLLSCPTRNLRPDLRPHCPSVPDHHPHPAFLSWKTAPHPSNRSLRAVLNLLPSHPKNSLLAQPSGSPRRRNSKSVPVFRRRPNELIPNLNPSPSPTRPQPASPPPQPHQPVSSPTTT